MVPEKDVIWGARAQMLKQRTPFKENVSEPIPEGLGARVCTSSGIFREHVSLGKSGPYFSEGNGDIIVKECLRACLTSKRPYFPPFTVRVTETIIVSRDLVSVPLEAFQNNAGEKKIKGTFR